MSLTKPCPKCGWNNSPIVYESGHESPPYSCEKCGWKLGKMQHNCPCERCTTIKKAQEANSKRC